MLTILILYNCPYEATRISSAFCLHAYFFIVDVDEIWTKQTIHYLGCNLLDTVNVSGQKTTGQTVGGRFVIEFNDMPISRTEFLALEVIKIFRVHL